MKENKTISSYSEIPSVYKDYKEELRSFISRRVNFKEDVEDILQNVFYNLSKYDLDENPIEQISSWLYAVTKNQITDYYRKQKDVSIESFSSDQEEEDVMDNILDLLSDPDDSPETQYIQSLVWVELEKALNELPEEQRSVFELTELQGFSNKEISESTGIPVNTLLSRKRYAILHLQKRLANLYQELISK